MIDPDRKRRAADIEEPSSGAASLSRALEIARFELVRTLRSRSFLAGALLLPAMILVGALVAALLEGPLPASRGRIGVVLFADTADFADDLSRSAGILAQQSQAFGPLTAFEIVPIIVDTEAGNDHAAAADPPPEPLAHRLREGDLIALVTVERGAIDLDGGRGPEQAAPIRIYTNGPASPRLGRWLERLLDTASAERRSRQAAIDPALFDKITRPLHVELDEHELGPTPPVPSTEPSLHGPDASAREGVRIATGSGLAVFLFVLVMTGAGRLLNGVLEEKMGRVGELMLGVVTAGELVLGKLVAGTLVTVLLAAIYVGGGLGLWVATGHSADFVSTASMVWLFVLLALQTAMVGSACLAVGAACGDFRDTQNLLSPLIAVITLPLVALPAVIRDPSSALSIALTLFPPSMPAVLLVRISAATTPPVWQLTAALTGGIATALAGIWAAAKVLRMGLLFHGKAASLRNLIEWLKA